MLGFVYLESAPTFPYELSFILQNPCHRHTSPKPALNPCDFVGRMNPFQMWEEHSLSRHHSLCTHVCRAHYGPSTVAAPGVQLWTGETKCLPSWHQCSGARTAQSREAQLKHLPPPCMVCASGKKTLITSSFPRDRSKVPSTWKTLQHGLFIHLGKTCVLMSDTRQEARMPASATNNLWDLGPKPVPVLRRRFLVEAGSQRGDALRGYLGQYTPKHTM